MIAETIAFLIRNLPAMLLALALVLGGMGQPRGPAAARFLAWILLLPHWGDRAMGRNHPRGIPARRCISHRMGG